MFDGSGDDAQTEFIRNTLIIIVDSLTSCLKTRMDAYIVHKDIYRCIPTLYNRPDQLLVCESAKKILHRC